MRVAPSIFGLVVLLALTSSAGQPWQSLTDPAVSEVAAQFKNPPPEYGATITWGWDGPMTEEVIKRDLNTLHAKGLRAVTIEAGYRMDNAPYLSDGWFKLVRFAAEEAARRGMRVWIIDEGKYPSGFAGGKFTQERPDLRMQGLGVAERIEVSTGETITRKLPPEVVGVIAVNSATREARSLNVSSYELNWTAPEGTWRVLIVDHQFRTPVTRAVNDPTGAKTTANSMGDLINPAATRQFIEWTHEGYRKHMGDLFGKAILGFRGDEPDFAHTPWTTDIVATFQERKGYDPRPYLAWFASLGGRREGRVELTEQQRRAKADYWDVWSDLFARRFFTIQANWCVGHGVEHTTHLNKDHSMSDLVVTTGDFFRAMRHVQIPGVDAIWNQVWPGNEANFTKFASSAAHVFGRPRALSESYAAYDPRPNVQQVRFGVNYQLVRGINLFEFMFYRSSAGREEGARSGTRPRRRRYLDEPEFKAVAEYANRASYLLAQGRPAAQIAVYFPTTSLWLGDREAEESAMQIARQLLAAQRDFDFVDEQALSSEMLLAGDAFRNFSGQSYRAVIIPSVTAISKAALDRLQAFAESGGEVIFIGRRPSMIVERSFLNAAGPGDLSWANHERSGEVSPSVIESLPAPDVSMSPSCPSVKAMHRRLRDADVYFLFNESEVAQSVSMHLTGGGRAQTWDFQTGEVQVLTEAVPDSTGVRVSLTLGEHEAKCIALGPLPSGP